MKAVVQRVNNASVTVEGKITGSIEEGILLYIGFEVGDDLKDIKWMVNKVPYLRVFKDDQGKMNLSVKDLNFGILVVSQFTLLGNCKRGRRPSYDRAERPEIAKELYMKFLEELQLCHLNVATGVFQAQMHVQYVNDGPITIILDSRE